MFEFSDDNEYLKEQLNGGEGLYCDFKHTINDASKIAKSIVAFANQKGGSLFIGVNDKGEIIGCEPKAEYHSLLNVIDNYCKPIIEFTCYSYEEDEKDVLEIAISEGENKPYAALNKKKQWNIYLRVNDECKKIG